MRLNYKLIHHKAVKLANVLIFLCLVLQNCISDEESNRQTNSPYQGNWEGAFTGSISGSLKIKINPSGSIAGTVVYATFAEQEEINGYVFANGKIGLQSRSGFTISGYLNSSSSSGEWQQKRGDYWYKGNYTLNKY